MLNSKHTEEKFMLDIIGYRTSQKMLQQASKGARWHSGRASDCESKGPGFETHRRRRVVSLSKPHQLPTVLVKPRKRWVHPDMTEKLLTGMLSLNTNKQQASRAS